MSWFQASIRIGSIIGRTDIGADHNLLSVIGKDEIGEGVTNVVSNTHPPTKSFLLGWCLIENFLPPVKSQVGRDISHLSCDYRQWYVTMDIDHVVEQCNDKESTEQPELCWSTSAIHDGVGDSLDILDASLNMVLVLVVWLRLFVLDDVKSEEVLDGSAHFNFGIVTHEAIHGAMLMNEVFQGR